MDPIALIIWLVLAVCIIWVIAYACKKFEMPEPVLWICGLLVIIFILNHLGLLDSLRGHRI